MPKINANTTEGELRKIAQTDVDRISKTRQKDPQGREYTWDAKRQGFFHIDADGIEWIMGIDSSVKGYWHYCPKVIKQNSKGYDVVCRTPHFVFIFQDGEKLTCAKCGAESQVNIVLPK